MKYLSGILAVIVLVFLYGAFVHRSDTVVFENYKYEGKAISLTITEDLFGKDVLAKVTIQGPERTVTIFDHDGDYKFGEDSYLVFESGDEYFEIWGPDLLARPEIRRYFYYKNGNYISTVATEPESHLIPVLKKIAEEHVAVLHTMPQVIRSRAEQEGKKMKQDIFGQ